MRILRSSTGLIPRLGLAALVAGCGSTRTDEDLPVRPDPALTRLDLAQERSTTPIDPQVPGMRRALPASSEVRSMAFSPDGRLLAAGDDQGGVLWDLETMAARAVLDDQPTPVSAVAFDPAGTPLATAGYRFDPVAGIVTLWDPASGTSTGELISHPSPVLAMAYSADGKTLVISTQGEGGAGKIAFVDVETGTVEDGPGPLIASAQRIVTSPDGSMAACGASTTVNYKNVGELVLYDLSARSEHLRPDLPIGVFHDLRFTPDGDSVVLAYQDRSEQGVVQLIDPHSGEPQETLGGLPGEVVALAIAPDGSTFALGDRNGRIHLLDLGSGAIRSAPGFHRGQIRHLAFSPDGRTLASSARDRRVALWVVEALQQLPALPGPSGGD
jgi:WD40 repeat protein